MSEPIRQESPLVERITPERKSASSPQAGVHLRERPLLGYVNLRGNPEDPAFLEAVQGVLELDLPVEPNTVATNDRIAAFWLGPNEWYVRTAAGAETQLIADLEAALSGQHFAANDLTSNLTTIELTGPNARDALEKGCTLDLHPRAFPEGQCAQTLVAKASVLMQPSRAGEAFEIVVRRSFADYLFVWLDDAAHEFGLGVAD